ncbi:MAG: DUF1631 family protein [Pseudomonadota bacterium]
MASQPDVLQKCLQEAARAARSALERCIDHAVAQLQSAELQCMKLAERDELADAWRLLQDNKPVWTARYPADLQTAFIQGSAAAAAGRAGEPAAMTAGSNARPQGLRGGLDAFSLVDDADVAQSITSARLLQHILPKVELALAELDTLISSALGLGNVRPELNPLRPEVFTRVLQDLMATARADTAIYSLWLKHIADPLGRELKEIYEKSIQLLERAHIQAAHYRVLQTPASAMGRPRGAGTGTGTEKGTGTGNGNQTGEQPAKTPSQYADLSNYEIRDELFQDFLFHGGSNAHHGLAASYYDTVEKELAELNATPDSAAAPLGDSAQGELGSERARQMPPRRGGEASRYQDMPAVDRPPRFVDALSQLSSQVWGAYGRSKERAMVRTQLKKQATKVGQVLGLEVVRKLVNQVAQDPRLLVPVREAIVALEPSLLRLAMVDPRFFSDEGHPGRRLMERVAQRSFKYNDEFSSEFDGFFKPVTRVFNELNKLDIGDARPFGAALASLEQGWDEQDQNESQNRRRVLEALRFAEERQEKADQIAFDLSARSDLDKVPAVVLDFLFGPWSLAMAHAKLTDDRNQIDPKGYGSVVPDLLWSVKRDVTLKRPAKLIEMIPGLLEKLHSGLDMLGQDPKENEKFFEALMKLHQPVLKLRRLKSRKDAEESGVVPMEPEEPEEAEALPVSFEQRRAKAAEQPWMGREDLDAAGFEDTLPTQPGDLEAMSAYMENFNRQAGSAESQTQTPATTTAQQNTATAGDAPGMDEKADMAKVLAQAVTAAAPVVKPVPGQTGSTEKASAEGVSAEPAKPEESAYTKEEAEALLMSLRTGSWVDLNSKRRWLRAQLIWASTKGTLFMFLSHGGQPHSMTKRSCEKLIMQRLLRPVDTHAVVAQALDAVASEVAAEVAHKNSSGTVSKVARDEPETV